MQLPAHDVDVDVDVDVDAEVILESIYQPTCTVHLIPIRSG